MSPSKDYVIAGEYFSKASLIAHSQTLLSDGDLASWKADIWSFILEWLDETSTVTLKTSGSTGTPKLVKIDKQYLRNSADMTIAFLGLKPLDTALLCLPAAYVAGKMMIVRALEGGMNLIFAEPSGNPLKDCHTSIDFAAMIPLQVEKVLDENASKLSDIKHLIIGGAAVSEALAMRLLPLDNNVWATYGMTETVSHVALKKLSGANASDFFSPLEGVVLFKDDRACLAIDAPHLAESTVYTNDMVELLSNGQFRFIGRFDNVINTGGVKVVPEQLEAKIKEFIRDEFIISSEPDERLGQRLILLIESSYPELYNEAVLLSQLRTKLTTIECPKFIRFIDELEKTKTGKVKR